MKAPIGNALGDPIFSFGPGSLIVLLIAKLISYPVEMVRVVGSWTKQNWWKVLLLVAGAIIFSILTRIFSPANF